CAAIGTGRRGAAPRGRGPGRVARRIPPGANSRGRAAPSSTPHGVMRSRITRGGPMSEHRVGDLAVPQVASAPALTAALLALNLSFNILANAAFRVSARSATWSDIVTWQVLGNLSGFVTVVTLTGLLRYTPLSIAFPVTTGLSIIGVQVVAAKWLFHEPIDAVQWAGSLLIGVGVFLVQR